MQLTALGAKIASSSVSPIAAVIPPREPVLNVLKTIETPGPEPDIQTQSAVPNITVADSTAPQEQSHSQVWATAFQAAQTGQGLHVNGDPLENPGLASVDDNGNVVKISLAAVTSGGEIEVEKTAAAPIPQSGDNEVKDLVANAPATSVEIPLALASHASVGESGVDPTLTTPPGFVLAGDVKLFNIIDAERFIFQGLAATDSKSEMVIPKTASVALDSLLPNDGISFGNIELARPSISYYNQQTSSGRGPGLWLDATVDFANDLAEVGNDLKDVFGHDSSGIAIAAALGGFQTWSAALRLPPDLKFQASIPAINAKFGTLIEFLSAEITSQAFLVPLPANPAKRMYVWGHLFNGQLLLTKPGSVAPLLLDYSLTREDTIYSLDLHLHESQQWTNAMGIPGMHLSDVHLAAKFDKASKGSNLEFDLMATLKVESLDLQVKGTYAADEWSIQASLDNITWTQLDNLYNEMFGAHLHNFDHNITFRDLQLEVSTKNRDLTLQGHLSVDDWCNVQSSITVSSQGFHLRASVGSATFGHVTLENVQLDIFVGKQGDVDPDPKKPGTSSSFTMTGGLEYKDLKLDATAYIDKDPKLGLLWAVYAKCETPIQLSHFFDLGSRSDLDLILENVVLMAANADTLGPLMPTNLDYEVKPGFQLCANIDTPRAISKSLNANPTGLLVQIDLASSNNMSVDLLFKTPQSISLKSGISAPTVKAGIIINDIPTLFIEADLSVQLSGQPGPLIFGLRLDANLIDAKATAELLTDWINPFGISPKVKVLSPVSLGVEIVYASGIYPSGVSFQGGIMVGETSAYAAFEVTDNPKEGVLLLGLHELGIKDIISFASNVIEHQLPQPASDFLRFEKMDFSISTGASIGPKFYPAGVNFDADMSIFGKTASVKCQVDKSLPGVAISGTVESFSLGPLSVTGHSGKDLSIDLKFGSGQQHLALDGEIRLWELDAAITVHADLHPLDLYFDTKLAFSDALDFELSAHIAGEIHDLKDLGHCDFNFDAELEQHILDYFMAHANSYILAAKKTSDEGIESAKAKLAESQKEYNDFINKKQSELDATKQAWDKQNAATTAAADTKKRQVEAEEASKRKEVDDAKAKLDAFINDLEKKLDKTRDDAKREVDKAKKAVSDEKTSIDNDVDGKVHKFQEAQAALSHSFGDADRALDEAKARVNAAQRDLDSVNRDLDNANRDFDHANFFNKVKYGAEIAGLKTERAAKQAAFAVANGILSAAKAVVDGAGYRLAHSAVSVAEDALAAAKQAGDKALDALNAGLAETQKVQDALVKAAENDLEVAKKECDQSKIWDAAKAALNSFLEAKAAVVAEADKAIEGLKTCAEKIAYDAATAAIGIARAGTKEIELAQHAVSLVEEGIDGVAALGQWMLKNAGNIFNIHKIKVSGTLGGAMAGKALTMAIDGEFADADVNFKVEFTPGKAEEMMKEAFGRIMKEVEKDAEVFVKKLL